VHKQTKLGLVTIAFLIPAFTTGFAQNENVFPFRGISPGMSQAQLEKLPPPDGIGRLACVNNAADVARVPELQHTSRILMYKDNITYCTYVDFSLNPPTSIPIIIDVTPAKATFLLTRESANSEYRLASISLVFPNGHFPGAVEALTKKFGNPTESPTSSPDTSWTQYRWLRPQGSIEAGPSPFPVDSSSVIYRHTELWKLFIAQRDARPQPRL